MKAIVYTSNTGHTAEYARMLGIKTNLPVYSLKEAEKKLENGVDIIYLGWIFANKIKGFKNAAKRYTVSAVLAVGLSNTGTALEEVRKANSIAEATPLFTLQGGMDKTKLRGINKLMIKMLTKGLTAQKERSEKDERMLHLLTHDDSYVSEENLTAFWEWYQTLSVK